jgi:DNA-binding protein YbaB
MFHDLNQLADEAMRYARSASPVHESQLTEMIKELQQRLNNALGETVEAASESGHVIAGLSLDSASVRVQISARAKHALGRKGLEVACEQAINAARKKRDERLLARVSEAEVGTRPLLTRDEALRRIRRQAV